MSVGIVEMTFIASCLIFSVLIILHKAVVSKLKDNIKISHFVAVIAFFLALYVILALLMVFLLKSLLYKAIMLVFALSPFIIGKLATYKKEKLYSFIQVLTVLLSAIVVILK